MPVMDEFREEREAIKHGTFKQKYQYFKDYYRMPLLITILALLFVGALVYQFVTKKDSAFYAALLNCSAYQDNEWFTEEYAQAAGIDLDKNTVILDSAIYYKLNSYDEDTYIAAQKLTTYAGAGQINVMMGGGDEFAHFANSALFLDLRQTLTPEQQELYQAYFYYVDGALMDRNLDVQDGPADSVFHDPRDPDGMKDPIPVALYVEDSERLNKAYYFKNAEDGIAVGIYANSSHLDNTLAFIDFLLAAEGTP
ncbi:MAG: hypothetical protein NC399_02630 [Muribaculum sp.]|nr:hypothetical protein [Muribaculum sp.]